ncbi:hypothetical protein B9Z19DRAFT_259965 [Tuber borchii]|uniref:Uncharacterized protein n=1 Tax=Tuber borchii TaxID=42251 RepID=A0A2T6ZLB9_TUBBO|nr:hypothetical protein B9Z19DRAFT_259965 [Tuber borchii]
MQVYYYSPSNSPRFTLPPPPPPPRKQLLLPPTPTIPVSRYPSTATVRYTILSIPPPSHPFQTLPILDSSRTSRSPLLTFPSCPVSCHLFPKPRSCIKIYPPCSFILPPSLSNPPFSHIPLHRKKKTESKIKNPSASDSRPHPLTHLQTITITIPKKPFFSAYATSLAPKDAVLRESVKPGPPFSAHALNPSTIPTPPFPSLTSSSLPRPRYPPTALLSTTPHTDQYWRPASSVKLARRNRLRNPTV